MRGRPFQKGEDERRNLNGRGRGPTLPPTLCRQAREDRPATFKRLTELRDQGDDLRIARGPRHRKWVGTPLPHP